MKITNPANFINKSLSNECKIALADLRFAYIFKTKSELNILSQDSFVKRVVEKVSKKAAINSENKNVFKIWLNNQLALNKESIFAKELSPGIDKNQESISSYLIEHDKEDKPISLSLGKLYGASDELCFQTHNDYKPTTDKFMNIIKKELKNLITPRKNIAENLPTLNMN